VQRLGASSDHLDVVQAKVVDHLRQERRTSQERFDQRDAQVRALNRQHQAWQSGAGADVSHLDAVRDGFREDRTVEQVPVP